MDWITDFIEIAGTTLLSLLGIIWKFLWNELRSLFTIAVAIPMGFGLRRVWHRCFTEYDRSMLIRLEPGEGLHNPKLFKNVPVIIGTFPFRVFDDNKEADLDIQNVVGFVIGDVRHIDDPAEKLGLNPSEWAPGYYAYCVINWEYASEVKRMWRRGIGIMKTATPLTDLQQRGSRFIGFGTDPPKGKDQGEEQGIAHFTEGICAFAQYQPYAKAGFKADDLKLRQLSILTRILIRFKNFYTKEWTDAR